jgi:integrase
MIRTLADAGGVGHQISGPHDLRRMFATTWARSLPDNIHLLQRQMGHANIGTTLIYIHNDPTVIREAINQQSVSPMSVLANQKAAQKQISASARLLPYEP